MHFIFKIIVIKACFSNKLEFVGNKWKNSYTTGLGKVVVQKFL